MIIHWLYAIIRLFHPRLFPILTFSYYIPAPPKRTTGYREKEFDRQLFNFLQSGYQLISLQAQSNNSDSGAGMWVIATVRSIKPKKITFEEVDLSTNKENSEVDGLYYIEET